MRRKLFVYTIMFMLGISAAHFFCDRPWIYLAAAATLCFLQHKSKKNGCTAICLFFTAGMILMFSADYRFDHGFLADCTFEIQETPVSGKIIEVSLKDEDCVQFIVNVNGERLLCNYYGNLLEPWLMYGCRISFSEKIELPQENGNPRCFNYRLYLKSKEVGYVTTITSFELNQKEKTIRDRIKGNLLHKREQFLEEICDSELTSGFIRGILFGDTSQMSEEEYTIFRQNGTAHVLAVSGLHIGILYSVYRWIQSKLHTKVCLFCFLMMLCLYGTVTLWSVSVTRATVLIVVDLSGKMLNRRYDLLTALSATAMLSMICNPYVIFGTGFQMSFLAVISIVFLRQTMEKIFGERLSVSVAVQAGLLPYMAFVFNSVSLMGVLCNIPVVYLVSLIVPAGVFAFFLFCFSGFTISFLSETVSALTEMTVQINRFFCAGGIFSVDVKSPPLWLVILCYCVLFYLSSEQFHVCFRRKTWRKLFVHGSMILILIMMTIPLSRTPFDQADIVFVDVGQGDCIHIKGDEGQNLLIDGGGNINYNVGEKTLKPYLLKNHCDHIDLAAATHLHTDHYLGIEQLASCFPVHQQITKGKAGDIFQINENQWIQILWPLSEKIQSDDENLNSLVFMIHHHGIKTLVTGDITSEGEAMLADTYKGTDKLKADILKVAHHGSSYSTSDVFLQQVQPGIAVISVGRNNYGHPSEIVIEKLEKKGIMVFRTDLDGAVGIIHRKGNLLVCTEKQR